MIGRVQGTQGQGDRGQGTGQFLLITMKQALDYLKIAIICVVFPLVTSGREPEPSFPNVVELSSSEIPLTKLGEYRYVYRMFFKLYDAALYVTEGAEADDVLAANSSYRLQFRYLREIDKSIILTSSTKMLEKNLSSKEMAQIAERVDRLNAAYQTVKEGDRSSLTYQPDTGTSLKINGAPVITIEGEDFARLYFKIWLGERPISETLRARLLGG